MRVLHVSTYDTHGGAGRAAMRLVQGLQASDHVDARLVVKARSGDHPEVASLPVKPQSWFAKRRFQLQSLIVRANCPPRLPAGMSWPASDFLAADLPGAVAAYDPDLVHLHWLCNDFIALEDLRRLGRPLIWTLHDSWPFTGGCHVPGSCPAYRDRCGNCPLLGGAAADDWSRRQWRFKQETYTGLDLTIVTPSRWMAACAGSSALLGGRHIEVIPNGLDTDLYRPLDRAAARQALGLPATEERVILFGGMSSTTDRNKGFDLLCASLSGSSLVNGAMPARLLIFGAREAPDAGRLGMPVTFLGQLRDDLSLVTAYSAADLMMVPSRQDNLPTTALEALACGLPVVGFNSHGLPDIVDHELNGFLASPYDVRELHAGICWALEPSRHAELKAAARRKAERTFSAAVVARRHCEFYSRLLSHPNQGRVGGRGR